MIPNAKPQVKRIEPMTPEQAAEWEKRKSEQWARVIEAEQPIFSEAMAARGRSYALSMVQTKQTFAVHFSTEDGFKDELVYGDPAKSVPKDDKLFLLRAIDLTDEEIKAAFAEWRLGRKLPPPPSRVM